MPSDPGDLGRIAKRVHNEARSIVRVPIRHGLLRPLNGCVAKRKEPNQFAVRTARHLDNVRVYGANGVDIEVPENQSGRLRVWYRHPVR